ncbi:MAG: hypothetical protein C7B46_18365 [Sulfobacillus benefaciens]|uniref:DUF202 domain-containing protein n=1 Tax=Sulfobacillus benefaciens TaxID=453960 RepID=A0A2T2X5I6_9FIRM|nr:MAG: hypothetical protein C7B46_18365 [Sulfobacillus benefaciens]
MGKEFPDPRTLLANERTFLSWLRTGIALMAFGFVVSKFDLFLHIQTHQPYHEGILGLFLVAGGVMIIAFASLHYHRNRDRLEHHESLSRSKLPMVMGLGLVVVGVLVFIYLFRAH